MEPKLLRMSEGESNSTTVTATRTSSNTIQDLISDLPDDLLHRIFSFLDMVYVTRTSFLSKRWRYVWTSLPYLNFSEGVYVEANREYWFYEKNGSKSYCGGYFEYFVDNVLSFRKHINIQTFHLSHTDSFTNGNSDLCTKRWINVAVWHNVEAVDLQINYAVWHNLEVVGLGVGRSGLKGIGLISQLFTCKTLTTLKLNWSVYLKRLELPNPKAQPAIKSLHLTSVGIKREEIGSFFSRLPVLETLIFSNGIAYNPTVCDHLQLKDIDINITYNRLPKEYSEMKMLKSCRDHCRMDGYNIESLTVYFNKYKSSCSLPRCSM